MKTVVARSNAVNNTSFQFFPNQVMMAGMTVVNRYWTSAPNLTTPSMAVSHASCATVPKFSTVYSAISKPSTTLSLIQVAVFMIQPPIPVNVVPNMLPMFVSAFDVASHTTLNVVVASDPIPEKTGSMKAQNCIAALEAESSTVWMPPNFCTRTPVTRTTPAIAAPQGEKTTPAIALRTFSAVIKRPVCPKRPPRAFIVDPATVVMPPRPTSVGPIAAAAPPM